MRPPTQKELTDPFWAFRYVCNVVKGRWEKGERIIITDPFRSYLYALIIIKGRWEKGERIIATDADCSRRYACYVIEGRFELGEPAIMSNMNEAYDYAKFVLKFDPQHIDFYEQCFRNNALAIHQLPQHLQDDADIQLTYFKTKVLT
jgi:hypothetical protein